MDPLTQALTDIARAPLSGRALDRIAADLHAQREIKYIVAPKDYRFSAYEEPENRHPVNQRFRQRIQSLRIVEFTLEGLGLTDNVKLIRRVIDDMVEEYRCTYGSGSLHQQTWRGA